MNILIAAGIYPPDIGGPATYSQKIATEFAKRGHQVAVVAFADVQIIRLRDAGRGRAKATRRPAPGKNQHSVSLIKIARSQSALARYLKYFWQIFKAAKGTDIIYAQGPVSAGLPAAVAGWLTGCRFILKVVGDVAWERYQNQKAKIKKQKDRIDNLEIFQQRKYDFKTEALKKIQKWVCRRAAKIIVPSQYLKKIVRGWGIKPEKIEVVYNAFSSNQSDINVNPGRTDAPHRSDPGKNKCSEKIILSVGRLVPWKGFAGLIELMPNMPPNYELKIVGDGPNEKKLKAQTAKLRLNNRVKFLGRLPHDQLLKLMVASDVFVLNTQYEGLPHIVLEAMACGLPVVTTNVGGNPEVIKNGRSGLLVEPDNQTQIKMAILKIVNGREFKEKIILEAQKSLSQFTEQKMLAQTQTILAAAAEKKSN